MTSLPFQIHVPNHKLDRLRQKLALSDFPVGVATESENSWDQGPPIAEIKRLASVWETSYDWRKAEADLNKLPHFIMNVEVEGFGSYDIHHIHQRSSRSDAIPLLFLHGWPGCFLEVTKMLNDLTIGAGDGPAFHVVAPSLIDFGFSSPSRKKGFEFSHHAETYDQLMLKLGYDKYVIQSGDMGHLIARFMAMKYGPARCKALHTNTPSPAQPTQETHPELYAKFISTPLSEAEQKALERTGKVAQEGLGYYKQLSTKPLTIGYSLKDSPIGLLAWLYEKLHDWADDYPWTDDEILTWVSIYYFSTAGPEASSNEYYAMEHSQPTAFVAAQVYIDVPLGIARFANDLMMFPKLWNQSLGPIVFESAYERGGHFAAWEQPEAIVKDLRSMFGKSRSAYGL